MQFTRDRTIFLAKVSYWVSLMTRFVYISYLEPKFVKLGTSRIVKTSRITNEAETHEQEDTLFVFSIREILTILFDHTKLGAFLIFDQSVDELLRGPADGKIFKKLQENFGREIIAVDIYIGKIIVGIEMAREPLNIFNSRSFQMTWIPVIVSVRKLV